MHKWVYSFGAGKAEGNAKLISLLGGKGANLAEMNKTIKKEARVYDYKYSNLILTLRKENK